MENIIGTRLLAHLAAQLRGSSLWGMLTVNEYLAPACALRKAFSQRVEAMGIPASNKLPEDIYEQILAGSRLEEFSVQSQKVIRRAARHDGTRTINTSSLQAALVRRSFRCRKEILRRASIAATPAVDSASESELVRKARECVRTF